MERQFRNPGATCDLILENEKEEILLVERKHHPYKGEWALPGGFLEYGQESLEEAGLRELSEEAHIIGKRSSLELIGVYSSPDRDPRGQVISHAYAVLEYSGEPRAGDDAGKLGWFSKKSLPRLAFDHNKILKDYFIWKDRRNGK
jgi:8-oxo-dGTP diphosphatase